MYIIRGYLLSIVDLCSGWVDGTKAGMIAYIFYISYIYARMFYFVLYYQFKSISIRIIRPDVIIRKCPW